MGPEVLSALACDSGQTVTVGADRVSPSFGSCGHVVLCILGLIEVSKATPTLKGLGLRLRKWNIRLGTASHSVSWRAARVPGPVRGLRCTMDDHSAWGKWREGQEAFLKSGDIRTRP